MSVATLFEEHILRTAKPKLVVRTTKQFDGAQSPRKSDRVSIDEEVKKSLDSIERVVENYSALQDNIHALKEVVDATEQELSAEKAANVQLTKDMAFAQDQISELQRLLSFEQLRLQETQTTVVAMGKVIAELENENVETRSHALRLVQGVEMLMATENSIHLGNDGSRLR